jgi:hypothetical protein
MITRIRLQNFKAHSDLDLQDLPLIGVLVGQNNTGKSTVLHAATLPKQGQRYDTYLPIGSGRLVLHEGGRGPTRVEIAFKPNVAGTPGSPTGTWLGTWDENGGFGSGWTSGPLNGNPAEGLFYVSALRQVVERFGYEPFGRDVGVFGEHTWNILHQLKANDEPQFPIILDWARRFGMGISAIGIPTPQPGAGQIAPTSYGHRTNIILHGSGTWSVLPIIVQGVLCHRDETLLIEEPESHLHRAAIDSLWEFFADCAKRSVQILCTTHSLDLLVSMSERIERGVVPKDSALYLFRRDKDGTITVERKDLGVFRSIRETIRKELAAQGF